MATRKTKATQPATAAQTASETAPKMTKLEAIIARLRTPEGASISDLMDATGWQAHSVRGVLAGALKKKRKLTVISEKIGTERVYRIQDGQA